MAQNMAPEAAPVHSRRRQLASRCQGDPQAEPRRAHHESHAVAGEAPHDLDRGIPITGRRAFEGGKALFIRDPDRNVIELVGPGLTVADTIGEPLA